MSDTTFQLTALRATRENILKILSQFSLEQMNEIPKGFNNNLIWNAGHVVVTQQLLCYKLAGLTPNVSSEMIGKYRKGSKPEDYIGETEKNLIISLLTSTVDGIETDLDSKDFSGYKAYPTSYGVTLTSVQDAVAFNLAHEAMHLGTMISLKNALNA